MADFQANIMFLVALGEPPALPGTVQGYHQSPYGRGSSVRSLTVAARLFASHGRGSSVRSM